MIARFVIAATTLAVSPAAHADGLNGWWIVHGWEKSAPTKEAGAGSAPSKDRSTGSFSAPPSTGFVYAPSPSAPRARPNPNTCAFEGQLALNEVAGKPTECTMTLSHSCSSKPPGSHLTVVEACTITREGDSIIKGRNATIADAKPAHLWPETYPADTFVLTPSADGKSMKGESRGKPAFAVWITRIADLTE